MYTHVAKPVAPQSRTGITFATIWVYVLWSRQRACRSLRFGGSTIASCDPCAVPGASSSIAVNLTVRRQRRDVKVKD